MAEQSVTLNPGESRVVSFEAIPKEAKTYQVVVDGLTGSFGAIEVPVAQFAYASEVRLTYLRHLNGNAAYRLEVDVQNLGNASGICHSAIYWHLQDPPTGDWSGWGTAIMSDNTEPYRDLELAPGEIGTVSGEVMWQTRYYNQWKVDGDAGVILSPII